MSETTPVRPNAVYDTDTRNMPVDHALARELAEALHNLCKTRGLSDGYYLQIDNAADTALAKARAAGLIP